MNYEDLKSTFLKGGYYRYDVPNFDVSILSINSMYFYKKVCDVDIIQGQLDWLEDILKKNKEKADSDQRIFGQGPFKFILAMHAFPGQQYFMGSTRNFWAIDQPAFENRFL